jgi:hypothetical protein
MTQAASLLASIHSTTCIGNLTGHDTGSVYRYSPQAVKQGSILSS